MYSANKIKKKKTCMHFDIVLLCFLENVIALKKYHIRKQTIKEGEVILNFNISNEQTCKKCEKRPTVLNKVETASNYKQ